VLVFLRFVGVTNAALWLGAIFFLTFLAEPLFRTPDVEKVLSPVFGGAASNFLLGRYYAVHFWFAGLALAHLLAEHLYAGKPLRRLALYLVIGLFITGLFAANLIQPRLERYHLEAYGILSTAAQREEGRRFLRLWHGTGQFLNSWTCLGVLFYFWQITTPSSSVRSVPPNKFRG